MEAALCLKVRSGLLQNGFTCGLLIYQPVDALIRTRTAPAGLLLANAKIILHIWWALTNLRDAVGKAVKYAHLRELDTGVSVSYWFMKQKFSPNESVSALYIL